MIQITNVACNCLWSDSFDSGMRHVECSARASYQSLEHICAMSAVTCTVLTMSAMSLVVTHVVFSFSNFSHQLVCYSCCEHNNVSHQLDWAIIAVTAVHSLSVNDQHQLDAPALMHEK